MAYNLLPCDRDQGYLMPASLRDWLGEDHLSWFTIDVMRQMDLVEFYAGYRSDGWRAAACDPAMMTAVLLYVYCQGAGSSRPIAQALEEDVGFRVVAANQQPDFRAVCRCRAEREKRLERLFAQVLNMCREAVLVALGLAALDGSKVAANASLAANRSHDALEAQVGKMLAEVRRVDEQEDATLGVERRGDEIPGDLGRRAERLQEAKARLEREAEGAAKLQQQRVDRRKAEEVRTGKRKRGRKPRELLPASVAKANTADPDSRTMKTRQGYVQGCNVQALVSQD